jgi:hypothetical protein
MEEFVHQEAKELCFALSRGVDITWPTACRNCDFEFPSNLKSVVSKALLNEPLTDLLRVVSATMRNTCAGHHYCCINNFKPTFKRPFVPPSSEIASYHVCNEHIMIEEGLFDWYDVSWDDDEESLELTKKPSAREDGAEEFSLFNLVQ